MKIQKVFGILIFVPNWLKNIETKFYLFKHVENGGAKVYGSFLSKLFKGGFIHADKKYGRPWIRQFYVPIFLEHPEWFDSNGDLIPNA